MRIYIYVYAYIYIYMNDAFVLRMVGAFAKDTFQGFAQNKDTFQGFAQKISKARSARRDSRMWYPGREPQI